MEGPITPDRPMPSSVDYPKSRARRPRPLPSDRPKPSNVDSPTFIICQYGTPVLTNQQESTMIDSPAIASKTKVAAASRRCVLASCAHSSTLASETPAQAPQSHNVRKCPVLSGLSNRPGKIGASPDTHTSCEQNPSCIDRTSVPQQSQAAFQFRDSNFGFSARWHEMARLYRFRPHFRRNHCCLCP